MVIIFYDATEDKVYICSETEKTKVLNVNDSDLLDYVPNDDILYVQAGHYITKKQFGDWLSGQMDLDGDLVYDYPATTRFSQTVGQTVGQEQPDRAPYTGPQRFYIHPTGNGTVLIEDIQTDKHPRGIHLNGKWHFISIDDVGADVLEESPFYRTLLAKGKLEVVGQDYVNLHKHKANRRVSPSEAALDRILVPADMRAEVAADAGGIHQGDVAVPIYID